jgi:hypothetical protein
MEPSIVRKWICFWRLKRKSWYSCVACDKLCCMQLSYLRFYAPERFDRSQLIEQIRFKTFEMCFVFVSIVKKSWHSCVEYDTSCCMQLSYLRCYVPERFDTSQLIQQIGFQCIWNMFYIRFDRIHFSGYELYACMKNILYIYDLTHLKYVSYSFRS